MTLATSTTERGPDNQQRGGHGDGRDRSRRSQHRRLVADRDPCLSHASEVDRLKPAVHATDRRFRSIINPGVPAGIMGTRENQIA
jgi:hypothetical protein